MGTYQSGDLEAKYLTTHLVVHFDCLQLWIAFFGVVFSQNQQVSSVHLLAGREVELPALLQGQGEEGEEKVSCINSSLAYLENSDYCYVS